MNKKKALITGITGQDGSYLAEYLLDLGYEVHGLRRRSSCFNTSRINHIYKDPHDRNANLFLHHGDLTDSHSLIRLVANIMPDEIYNLAAQSHVAVSFESPEYTANADGVGTLRLLEAVKLFSREKNIKFYQASTSELFGLIQDPIQSESTQFYPRSPYGVAKLYAYWITVNYREAYDLFACNGILFNHESPRRGETFVTRKITIGLSRILKGKQECLYLGNLNSLRDWGHAKDYITAMHKMLQLDIPQDLVIATGRQITVRKFVEMCLASVGQEIEWQGQNQDEKGFLRRSGKCIIHVDPEYFRPTEVDSLVGDPTKAKELLDWQPSISVESLAAEMMKFDMENSDL